MKLINPSVELIQQQPGLLGIYRHIEKCARNCYKSEDKITNDSYMTMYNNLVQRRHLAMLEHGTVYLYYKECCYSNEDIAFMNKYKSNPYSKVISLGCDDTRYPDGTFHDIMGGPATGDCEYVITTNLRVIIENHWEDDLQYICEPTEYHEKRYTVRFTCDRGVSHELVRHRVFSFAKESTRYCNYSNNKFGNELTFIIPSWCTSIKPDVLEYSPFEITPKEAEFMQACFDSEKRYFLMLKSDATPQEARQVLINALKTEIVMTGFIKDWKHFFSLRTSFIAATGKPHPDMSNLADNLYTQFKKEQFI